MEVGVGIAKACRIDISTFFEELKSSLELGLSLFNIGKGPLYCLGLICTLGMEEFIEKSLIWDSKFLVAHI